MSNLLAVVIATLIQIESGGNRFAVGDGGRAIGILQQHRVSVTEANRIVGYRRWTFDDRRDPAAAKQMCWVTLERHYRRGMTDPVKLACRWRNPYSDAPQWYRKRVAKALAKEGLR